MDAIRLLKQDHRTVEALFKKFERAGVRAVKEKATLAQQITRELSIHASIEEQVLYPAVRARSEKLKDLVLEALEEHHLVKATLAELERMSPEDERFVAKMTVLMENVRHHVEAEEEELFPKLQKLMALEELKALGTLLERTKTTAPTHPHPMSPDAPPGNLVADPLAKVLDLGRDAANAVAEGAKRAVKTRLRSAAKVARRARR